MSACVACIGIFSSCCHPRMHVNFGARAEASGLGDQGGQGPWDQGLPIRV
jgi:hypothetical protein